LDLNVSDHVNLDQKVTTQFDKLYKDYGGLALLIEERIAHKIIPKTNEKDKVPEKSKVKSEEDEMYYDEFDSFTRPQYGNNRVRPSPFGGDFGGDLNPIPGGIGGIGGIGIGGGGLMGPRHPRFNGDVTGGSMPGANPRPGVPDGARFDPYGPGALGNQTGPDPDHMRPPRRGNGSGNNDPYGMFL